jgi:hypothetical protein
MRISTRTFSVMAGCLFVLSLSAGVIGGCGGGSSAPSFSSLCMEYCNKCEVDAGATYLQVCKSTCTTQANQMATCSNESAIANAAQSCINMSSCSAVDTCLQSLPDCQSGGGGGSSGTHTGGTSGGTGTGGVGGHPGGGATGGTTGAAGNGGGTADCSICTKANTCCTALAAAYPQAISASDCTLSTANCTATGASSAGYVQTCQVVLTEGQALSVAACQ